MYNDQLVYKVIIWAFFGISLWTKKVALSEQGIHMNCKRYQAREGLLVWYYTEMLSEITFPYFTYIFWLVEMLLLKCL